MSINKIEFSSVVAAIDFITTNADGADDDKYPYDILDGLISIREKFKKERSKRRFNSLVKKKVKEITKSKH